MQAYYILFINVSLHAWVDLAEVESVEGNWAALCCHEDLGDRLIWHSKGVSMKAFTCLLMSD